MQKLVLLVFTVCTLWQFNPFASSLSEKYINRFHHIATSEMKRTGIPASIKLAQGLLESDWGRSNLANTANNHFGIKCGSSWSGETFFKEDDDYVNGKLVASCFRAYANAEESYIAHSDFLKKPRKSKRYDFLFDLDPIDYKAWARGLQKAGYATDPAYPLKLINIIEKYHLHQFDLIEEENTLLITQETTVPPSQNDNRETVASVHIDNAEEAIVESIEDGLEHFEAPKEFINKVPMVRAQEGETALSIARRYKTSVNDLLVFNEKLNPEETLQNGEIIFLDNKKRKYGHTGDYHVVKEGETMYSISQNYGIKLANLYAKNRMPKGSEPYVDEKLHLGSVVKIGKRPKFKTDRKLKQESKSFLFEDFISSN